MLLLVQPNTSLSPCWSRDLLQLFYWIALGKKANMDFTAECAGTKKVKSTCVLCLLSDQRSRDFVWSEMGKYITDTLWNFTNQTRLIDLHLFSFWSQKTWSWSNSNNNKSSYAENSFSNSWSLWDAFQLTWVNFGLCHLASSTNRGFPI